MSGENISLRPAEAADHDFLFAVYASSRAAEMALAPWSAEQKDAFLRMQFAAQSQHYAAEYPQATHHIICDGQVPVGRIYLARREENFHILDITILPQFQRTGIGSCVLTRLLEEAGRSAKPVTIYVESFNPSLKLFRKLGFEAVSESGVHLLLLWKATPNP